MAEAFRRPDRCFLATPEGPLDENTLLDLSHESLIRQWHRLADWVTQETQSTEIYQRLRDWALRWEQGNAELWRGPDLASAVAWREREAPNEAWAERYGGRDQFLLAMKFLDASEEAQRAAVAAEEAKRQQQLTASAPHCLGFWRRHCRRCWRELLSIIWLMFGITPPITRTMSQPGAFPRASNR